VTNALNFSTSDCHVIGGCDVYTTKAAGGDKKLYKNIEHSLESQYESLVRLSASLSPPCRSAASDDGKDGEKSEHKKRGHPVERPEIDLSRPSPFGPLSQINARRTFAYLIATLNASHPDYDFSHLLRPSDFRKERSLRAIMQNVDSTLQNLRPKPSLQGQWLAPPPLANSKPATNSAGNEVWSTRMWSLMDKEMSLRQCDKYAYVPDDDPFDGEEGSIWSMHYFFFNKERKRVCYFYLRGLSVISHSPVHAPVYMGRPSQIQRKSSSVSVGDGATKRASYWLGNRILHSDIETENYGDDDDDDEMMVVDPDDDDEVEVPHMDLDDIRSELVNGYHNYDLHDDDDFRRDSGWTVPKRVRGMSEEIGDAMEM